MEASKALIVCHIHLHTTPPLTRHWFVNYCISWQLFAVVVVIDNPLRLQRCSFKTRLGALELKAKAHRMWYCEYKTPLIL